MAARNYTNTHTATTLQAGISAGAVQITLTSNAGLPVVYPYTLVLEPNTAKVEVVSVTGIVGSNLSVTRGEDGTLAQSHDPGVAVVHALTARDAAEPQTHMNTGTNVHGVGASSNVVGTATAQTLTNKTLSGAANTLTGIPDSAIVAVAAAKVTQPFSTLSVTGAATVGSVTVNGNSVHTGTTTLTGTTTAGTLNAASVAVSGSETVTGNQTVNGSSSLKATTVTSLTDTGNATVGGTLGVTGATTLGALSAASAAVSGTLGVTGTATVGTVNASGTVTAPTVNATTDVQRAGVSLPRGYAASGSANSTFSTSAETLIVSATFTATAARRYKITFDCLYDTSVTTANARFRIRYNTGTSTTVAGSTQVGVKTPTGPGTAVPVTVVVHTTALPAGQVTVFATVDNAGGGHNVVIYGNANSPSAILVEDIGT